MKQDEEFTLHQRLPELKGASLVTMVRGSGAVYLGFYTLDDGDVDVGTMGIHKLTPALRN